MSCSRALVRFVARLGLQRNLRTTTLILSPLATLTLRSFPRPASRVLSTSSCHLAPQGRPRKPKAVSANDKATTDLEKLTHSPVQLRLYQSECIDACIRALGEGLKRIAVSAPTGSGKTVILYVTFPRLNSI